MKRAFLFGLATAFIMIGAGHVILGNEMMPRSASIAIGAVALFAGVLAIVAARKAKPHPSWLVKVTVWIVGYLAFPVVGLGLLETARIVPLMVR